MTYYENYKQKEELEKKVSTDANILELRINLDQPTNRYRSACSTEAIYFLYKYTLYFRQ